MGPACRADQLETQRFGSSGPAADVVNVFEGHQKRGAVVDENRAMTWADWLKVTCLFGQVLKPCQPATARQIGKLGY